MVPTSAITPSTSASVFTPSPYSDTASSIFNILKRRELHIPPLDAFDRYVCDQLQSMDNVGFFINTSGGGSIMLTYMERN